MTATDIIYAILAAVAGSGMASVAACIPGLHIYSVLAALALGVHALIAHGIGLPPAVLMPFTAGMIVGWALNNSIPSILLGAPDESALFTVLPGQMYLMNGRGHAATMLTVAGGLGSIVLMVLIGGPMAPRILPLAHDVLRPHYHWIVWTVICFMLMSEWPMARTFGQGGWRKLVEGWKPLGMGLLTFLLSGLLGFVLMYRSPIAPEVAFQNLMPAFSGLFAVPWLLINIASAVDMPRQRCGGLSLDADRWTLLRGVGAGTLGGGFAAFLPGVTGGIGGFLAGHATAQRSERAFLVSQGASKAVYYAGSFLLLFVPGSSLTRGGGAWLMKGIHVPTHTYEYPLVLASIAIAAGTAVLLASPLARACISVAERHSYRHISCASLFVIAGGVAAITGWRGLAVMLVATGIGLLPVLFGSRRMNCLGVILLPLACNMSGFGPDVAGWLGLL